MLHLRVFGVNDAMAQVAERLDALPGLHHVMQTGNGDSRTTLVSADLDDFAADSALDTLRKLEVPADDIVLMRLDAIGHEAGAHALSTVIWTDLLTKSRINARPLARYLVFMAVAGIIAGCGVIYENEVLVVGAMAVSPDMLPIIATCTGLVLRRWKLAERGFGTLVIGLGFGCVVAAVMTAGLDLFGLLPHNFHVGATGLEGLVTVNGSTVLVALAAGVAGTLAFETRASAAVGVAISVTTIPASAYLGVAAGVGEEDKAVGALVVLGVNVAMIMLGGSTTLFLQRRVAPGRPT
jgi:uncharacterized hydrophobic protein (TIGR00271 family)